jgi:hypothetical protein
MRMRTKKRKRTRTTSGSSIRLVLLALVLSGLAAWLGPAAQGESRKEREPYAVVAGTVFRDPGFALPGAEVSLIPDPAAKPARKVKKQKTISDSRGEFFFRTPAVPMRYKLVVKAKAFEGEERAVEVQGEDRLDVSFRLVPTSK